MNRKNSVLALSAGAALLWSTSPALSQVVLFEDFDGGGVNSVFTHTVSGGYPPPLVVAGGPSGNFLRETWLTGGNHRSTAWDYVPFSGPQVELSFDFRLSTDDDNANYGGCCGQAADGVGVGLFAIDTYGATGGIDPAGEWEHSAFPDAFVIHFDLFDSGGGQGTPDGNQVKVTWAGMLLANETAPFTLNNGIYNRARLIVTDAGSDSLASLVLIEDVNGAAVAHTILSGLPVPGLDLDAGPVGGRLILGGRTGGAFHESDFDNIALTVVPEPATYALVGLGLGLLLVWRRRR